MKLFCITGIDGAGKSTLARETVAELRAQGVPAQYLYGRTYPVLSRLLMAVGRATLLRGKDPWKDYSNYVEQKNERMRNPALAIVYGAAILLDYHVQLWLKTLPHLFSGRTVVADRYVYDTVISDLAVHLGFSEETIGRATDWCLKFAPIPLLTVLIDLPVEVAFARKDDVPHVDFLRERQRLYRILANRPEVIQFDGQDQPESLVRRLVTEILAHREGPELKGKLS